MFYDHFKPSGPFIALLHVGSQEFDSQCVCFYSSLPDNVVCDIAGMVVYVGRVEREATKGELSCL